MSGRVAKLRAKLAREGLAGTARWLAAALAWRLSPRQAAVRRVMRENAAFDREHGTDTAGEIALTEFGFDAAAAQAGNGVYRGISSGHFEAALRELPLRFENYTFLDYGSGKGKALLLAAALPFARVIGIEYAEGLHRVADANLRRLHPARVAAGTLVSIHADATSYEPPAGPLVCFFFNPFDESVWAQVLARLADSYRRTPRPIHLVYVNIRDVRELGDVFAAQPCFRPVVTRRHVRVLAAGV